MGRKMEAFKVKVQYVLSSKLFKGGYIGDYIGDTVGVTKGDTRSLDYSSYENLAI